MTTLDLVVFVFYAAGVLAMGAVFLRIKSTREMFAAGGRSPWWLAGLSAFMTIFSAGTFVVWGGIAYRHGLVAVSILFVIGVAALGVGWCLAARWKSFGYDSAADFLSARFGRSLVQFYTWLHGTVGIFTLGGAIYALSVIVCALVPLPAGHLLADPATGNLSVTLTSLTMCAVVMLVTSGGGLWAVLMTDALQFIILAVAVLVVVPLIVLRVGGVTAFVAAAPQGFFSPTAGEFTWVFLAGWSLTFFFKVGGEWAYVQRFACVPSARDARKAAYLFGALYLVSPFIWMLPPMAYRLIDANANHEQAYILACKAVLPAGMLGLMLAAMCSATASTVTTQLNVYAGAFTTGFYREVLRPRASERELVLAGRAITLLLGGIAIAGALLIPRLGTYTGFILASVAMLTGPLVLPTIWGLFSRRIGLGTAWAVTLSGIAGGLAVKFGFARGGWFDGVDVLAPLAALAQANARVTEIAVGTLVPLGLLAVAEIWIRETHPGWTRVEAHRARRQDDLPAVPSPLPARLFGWSTATVATLLGILACVDREESLVLGSAAGLLAAIGAAILLAMRAGARRPTPAQTTDPAQKVFYAKE